MKKIPKWSIGIGLGVIFLVLGAFGDQFTEIYRKAVMICLECIGIGQYVGDFLDSVKMRIANIRLMKGR